MDVGGDGRGEPGVVPGVRDVPDGRGGQQTGSVSTQETRTTQQRAGGEARLAPALSRLSAGGDCSEG